MQIPQEIIDYALALRHKLHNNPEISLHEEKTRSLILNELQKIDNIQIRNMGNWIYAKDIRNKSFETIVLRADFDALKSESDQAYHGCGHDGHTAILLATAKYLSNEQINRNIIYLFQHAEEIGEGAKDCLELFKIEKVDKVYGLHNWPGNSENVISTKEGVVQCASTGMKITINGKKAHAAEPEKAINPIISASELIQEFKSLSFVKSFKAISFKDVQFKNSVFLTFTGFHAGKKNEYGTSPATAEIYLTLRSVHLDDLEKLEKLIDNFLKLRADEKHFTYSITYSDFFTETENDPETTLDLIETFKNAGLKFEPLKEVIKASEDFGLYLKEKPGAFFYLGAGDIAPLHSLEYEFNDKIISTGIKAFSVIAKAEAK